MRLLIQSVLESLLCILILSAPVAAVPDKPFYQQNESTQHFVYEKGQRFRFFQFNMPPSGVDAKLDSKTGLTGWPSLWLNDQSEETRSFFFQHGPIWIKPFTQYQLTYQMKVDAIEGPPPYIQTVFYDYNTDAHRHQDYSLDSQPTAGWVEKQIVFQTDADTYEFRLFLWSTPRGLCDVHFDRIYLEQVSESGAFKPPRIILIQGKTMNFTEESEGERLRVELPADRETYRLDFYVSWDNVRSTKVVLAVDWVDNKDNLLGRDFCQINPINGIRPEWDGLATRWTTERGNASDKASRRLDWHFNTCPTGGESRVERILQRPQGAGVAKISIQEKNKLKGAFLIQDLAFSAEY